MKKRCALIVLGIVLSIPFNANSQTFLTQNFTTFTDSILPPLASGWKNTDSTSPPNGQIWRFDNPGSRTVGPAMSGKIAILDSDWYGPSNSQDAYLTSPVFNASTATVVILEFDHFFQNLGSNVADVEVFDGNSWFLAASYAGTTTANAAHETLNISTIAAGKSACQIRFHYTGSYAWYWLIDNINVYQPQPDDMAVISVDSLINGCSLDSIPISATVANVGTTTITSFALNYRINGGPAVIENVTATLLPNATYSYTFNQYANVSTIGTYDIDVYSFIRYDANNVNDTASGTAIHLISNSTFPYTEGFETGNGGWLSDGVNNSWQVGAPAGFTINSAASGTQAYVTNLTGPYNNNEVSSVTSPCFDFSSLTQPQFKMNIWIENESGWDGTILQSSLDGGITWQMVGALNDPVNWYNGNANAMFALNGSGVCWTGNSPLSTGGWILAEHDLTGLAGQSSVRLRILHATDGSVTDDGFAFDNILIQDAPANDAGITQIVRPNSGCALGTVDSIEVRIFNPGSTAISNFGVNFTVNGGTPITETYTGTIVPGDTINYVFTNTVNLSALGTYNLKAYTSLVNDGNVTNDTLDKVITNIPVISSFPYSEGFETGNGGWLSTGVNNTWQVGSPVGVIINSAAAGTEAWVTNLTGPYNNNEISYVESPCFDFTSLAQPQLKLNIWIESESGWDGTIVQSSIDAGQTWQMVGALNDPVNWYNGTANAMFGVNGSGVCWNGSSPLSTGGWILAEHDLTGLGGQSAVKIRLLFASDGSVQQDGFAFDNILIQDAPSVDVKMIAISAPESGCGLSTADTVKILLANVGSGQLDTIPVSYSVIGGNTYYDTSYAVINPGDTIEFAFDSTYDFSNGGLYTISAKALLLADANPLNDSISKVIENTLSTLQSVPYTELFDFNGFVSGTGFDNLGSQLGNGWTANPAGSPDYFWGARNGATGSGGTGPNFDHTGNNGNYIYTEGSNGLNGSVAELYSPCIDLTTTIAPRLEFFYHKYGGNMSTLYIDIFNGSTWVTLDSIVGQTQTANLDPYLSFNRSLVAFAGSVIQVRFRSGPKTGFATDMAIDDFRVFEPSSNDAGLVDIYSPVTSCGKGSADSVVVVVTNFGTAQLDTIPMAYRLNQGPLVIDTLFSSLLPGDTALFYFNTTVNLSATGSYTLDIFTNLVGDGDRNNDSLNVVIDNLPVVTYPYFEDFETSNGGWTASGVNSSWSWGAPIGVNIANAGSGVNSWVTNLTGPYNANELSYLTSPCIDLSALTVDPTISFQHTFDSELNFDESWLEVSIDGGNTWTKSVTNSSSVNWYNNTTAQYWEGTSNGGLGVWVTTSNVLVGTAGQSDVKVRFVMSSDGSVQNEGFGIDSLSIDLATGINEPISKEDFFSIYPNPSEGQFIMKNGGETQDYNIMIFDTKGKLVYDQRFNFKGDQQKMIDLSEHSKGVYFMKINNENSSFTKRIIIQ